ncbi:cobalt-zinc-cadmium efflux system protein [Pustulibacterium marinum]|uniref:Cobalt-zinc-cadmium efflux system protein n=1 Tax=Pustulibacterium marinum TaxID=1224947 RepID=A0A1I7ETA4_9FLAO|nr:cation diffusion facilitator family transporter [Pustulibacterium marinum]SFU27155.1 cobalt-zinc-cadmium efflux system protein [Pustulibacterium marinum]
MSHHHHHHHHDHGNLKGKNLLFSIFLNVLITASQVVGGIISGSLSLISDALHNLTDVISLIISYVANQLSKKKASTNRTFGYKRAEILAAFVNSSSLIIVALYLIKEAVERFLNPVAIQSGIVIWLAILGIVANGLSVLLLKKHSEGNMNMKSAYIHLLTDMLASIAVLVGGFLMKYFEIYWVDSVLTAAIAVYLIYMGYDLLKTSTRALMLFVPENIDLEKIIEAVHEIKYVNKLHHIHVWNLNDDEVHLEAHLDFSEDITISQFDEIQHEIEHLLHDEFGINHINLQPEFKKQEASKDFIVQD